MLSEDLKSISAELGTLADKVDAKIWEIIRLLKQNLEAAVSGVEDLEQGVINNG